MSDTNLYSFLSQFLNPRRLQLIEEKISYRSRYASILLEDVYQSKNISAVLRTAECIGIQDVHIIENKNRFEYNPYVTRGADKWLTLHRYNTRQENSLSAIKKIKNDGYRLIATSPNIQGSSPENFDIKKGKFVIAFGNEWEGVSDVILNEADEHIRIPMHGYTESLNLSVSVAIITYTLVNRLRNSDILWHLSQHHSDEIKLKWAKAMLKRPELLIDKFYKAN